jgi:transcriptional regulator with XRE-family HTH domain
MGARQSRKPSSLFGPGHDQLVGMLVEMRENAGLTQQQLAVRLGRHRSFVWKTEGGQRRLDLIEFVKWCRVCGADADKAFRRVSAAIPQR